MEQYANPARGLRENLLHFISVLFRSTNEPVTPFCLRFVFHSVSSAETEPKRNEKSHSFFISFALNSAASFGLNQTKRSGTNEPVVFTPFPFRLSLRFMKRNGDKTEWD